VFTFLQAIEFDVNQNLYAAGHAQHIGTSSTNMYSSFFVRKSTDYGTTWQTVLDLEFPGYNAFYMGPGTIGFAGDSAGAVYIFADLAGSGTVLFKSSDAGMTWTTLRPFSDGSYVRGMVCTPAGLFVTGGSIVRKSTNGGATWQTVDSGYSPTAICADAQGNIYTGGGASVTTGSGRKAVTTYEWIMRKGTNGGTTWKTAAAFSVNGFNGGPNPSYTTTLDALHFDAAGNLYAAGSLTATNGSGNHGMVVKSPDQGMTWTVVDDFQFTPADITAFWFLTSDPAGAVYTRGTANGPVTGSCDGSWGREQCGGRPKDHVSRDHGACGPLEKRCGTNPSPKSTFARAVRVRYVIPRPDKGDVRP